MDQGHGDTGRISACLIGGGWLLGITGSILLVTVMVGSQTLLVLFGIHGGTLDPIQSQLWVSLGW